MINSRFQERTDERFEANESQGFNLASLAPELIPKLGNEKKEEMMQHWFGGESSICRADVTITWELHAKIVAERERMKATENVCKTRHIVSKFSAFCFSIRVFLPGIQDSKLLDKEVIGGVCSPTLEQLHVCDGGRVRMRS